MDEDELNRTIGKLLAHQEDAMYRLERIELKVDSLQNIKFKFLGAISAVSVIISGIVSLAIEFFYYKR
jgi:hypothetical protein